MARFLSRKLCDARAPFLRSVSIVPPPEPTSDYAFRVPVFREPVTLELRTPVTFFVGENGSGKSTLLEAIAFHCGFNLEGGNRDHRFSTHAETPALAGALKLSWFPKVTRGYFLRAESFFNVATYLDSVRGEAAGRSLHSQSHGESFLTLFRDRFSDGIFILDEPEAALSPQRQLSFLKILHDLEQAGRAQFLIATHSPMLLAYPGATIFSLDHAPIEEVGYAETEHFRLMKHFLESPERFLRHLFDDRRDAGTES